MAVRTSGQFSARIKGFAEAYQKRIEAVAKDSTTEAFHRVIDRSPRKTGAFVGNWNVGDGGAKFDPSVTDLAAMLTKSLVTTAVLQSPLGGRVRLFNPAPYGMKLEFGHSKQAPQGMVRITAAEWPAIVAEKAGEAKAGGVKS